MKLSKKIVKLVLFELHFRFYGEIEAWPWYPSPKRPPTCTGVGTSIIIWAIYQVCAAVKGMVCKQFTLE